MPILHKEKSEEKTFISDGPVLKIQELHYDYPDGHKALHGISLQIENGEKVALVGPNGSGKSTLMLHINGLLNGEGKLSVGGMPVIDENYPIIRAKIGLVFQNPDDQLFSPTVYEDVAFGPLHMGLDEAEVKIRVDDALEAVGMLGYAQRYSYHLSVGEKKRIAIATVLSMGPELLILDEPSAGLDPRARRSLINLLRELPLTMLVATHDMLLVKELFERTIVLDKGLVVADGKTEDLLRDIKKLEAHGLE